MFTVLFAAILSLVAGLMLFVGLLVPCPRDKTWAALMLCGIGLALVACVWAILGTGTLGG